MDRLPPAVAVASLAALAGCAGQIDTRGVADGPASGVAQVEPDRTTVAAGGTGEATAAAARADAETAAASADLALVGVAALSVEDRDDRPFLETAADRGGADTEFVPGEVTVIATVRVTYVAEGA